MAKKRRLPIEDEIVSNLASCSTLSGKFQVIPHDKRWEISINGLPYREFEMLWQIALRCKFRDTVIKGMDQDKNDCALRCRNMTNAEALKFSRTVATSPYFVAASAPEK